MVNLLLEKDLSGLIGILEAVHKRCEVDEAEKSTRANTDKLLKGVKLSTLQLARKYCEDGGIKHNKPCARCGHELVDRQPDFEKCRRKNAANTKKFENERQHLKEYHEGGRADALLDPSTGKPITKVANPKRVHQIVTCKCWQNFSSQAHGGQSCLFGCRIGGTQYSLGQCPVCLCPCRFAYDSKDQQAIQQAVELEKLTKTTTPDERSVANEWLGMITNFGNSQKEQTVATLEDSAIDLTGDEMDQLGDRAAYNSQAHFIAHNPPSSSAQTFLQKVVAKAAHPKGHAYSNVTGAHMRNVNQASAARAKNTRLSGAASQSNNEFYPDMEAAIERSLRQPQPTGRFSNEETINAMKASLFPNDASNHSNLSMLSGRSLLSSHHQHSHSTPMNHRQQFKTPEEERTPEYVEQWAIRCIDHSFDSDCEDYDNTMGASGALTNKPYNATLVRVAGRVDKKYQDGNMTSPEGVKQLAKSYGSMKK